MRPGLNKRNTVVQNVQKLYFNIQSPFLFLETQNNLFGWFREEKVCGFILYILLTHAHSVYFYASKYPVANWDCMRTNVRHCL